MQYLKYGMFGGFLGCPQHLLAQVKAATQNKIVTSTGRFVMFLPSVMQSVEVCAYGHSEHRHHVDAILDHKTGGGLYGLPAHTYALMLRLHQGLFSSLLTMSLQYLLVVNRARCPS